MALSDQISRTARHPGVLRGLRRAYLLMRRVASRAGLDLVYASYDSPIPNLATLPPGFFERPSPMRGIAFDAGAQMNFVESELAEFCREFAPPRTEAEAGPYRFHLANATYDSVDAELLYAIVRRFAPHRIVELGSGYSTLIIREALARGGGAPDTLQTYDPYPSPRLPADWPVTRVAVQDVDDDVFTALDDGDVLFVDTTHTVKEGGDVNRIVLDVLPLLAPGVMVHFHDIFLPYPYSRAHLEDAHFWSEQYLLQAFLIGNPGWEVLVGGQAVARTYPDRLRAAIPSFAPGVSPGAFWIRRQG